MPSASTAGRTKTVETKTVEEIPVNERETEGLGMSCLDYLASIPDEELPITTATIYRTEPRTQDGWVMQVNERVDEAWIYARLGGGTFNLKVRSKTGKSGFQRDIKIAGAPKFLPSEAQPGPPAAHAPSADNGAILALLEKTIDRLERLQTNMNTPPRSAADDSVVEIMATAAKRGIELAGGGAPAVREADEMDKMLRKAMIDRLLAPPAAPVESDFDKQLKKVMLDRLLAPPPSQNKSLIEELKGLTELRELMGWSEGPGKAEHWTTALVNGVVQRAPELLDKLAEQNATKLEVARTELRRAEVIANARRGAAAPPTPVPQTSANAPRPMPTTATSRPMAPPPAGPLRMAPMGGGVPPAPPSAPPEVVSSEPPSLAGIDTESPVIVQFVKERVVAMVQEGTPGGGIVAFLIGMRQQKFVQMLVKYNPEEISTFLRADPLLRQAVEHPDWPDVLEEARSYVRDQEAAAASPPLVQ